MPPHLQSVPANYQSGRFLGLIFAFGFSSNCWMLQTWFSVGSVPTCNVQTYKMHSLWSFLVAIIKGLAFDKLFCPFPPPLHWSELLSSNPHHYSRCHTGRLNLARWPFSYFCACLTAGLVSYPGVYDFINGSKNPKHRLQEACVADGISNGRRGPSGSSVWSQPCSIATQSLPPLSLTLGCVSGIHGIKESLASRTSYPCVMNLPYGPLYHPVLSKLAAPPDVCICCHNFMGCVSSPWTLPQGCSLGCPIDSYGWAFVFLWILFMIWVLVTTIHGKWAQWVGCHLVCSLDGIREHQCLWMIFLPLRAASSKRKMNCEHLFPWIAGAEPASSSESGFLVRRQLTICLRHKKRTRCNSPPLLMHHAWWI